MINRAIQAASRSTFKRYKTGAVIADKRGNIISVGWSHMTDVQRTNYYSMHAELHAILRADHKRLRGTTIYIATIAGKSGNPTSSKPCKACEAIIKEVGISAIVYTERREL